jgi:hypothetical protein
MRNVYFEAYELSINYIYGTNMGKQKYFSVHLSFGEVIIPSVLFF